MTPTLWDVQRTLERPVTHPTSRLPPRRDVRSPCPGLGSQPCTYGEVGTRAVLETQGCAQSLAFPPQPHDTLSLATRALPPGKGRTPFHTGLCGTKALGHLALKILGSWWWFHHRRGKPRRPQATACPPISTPRWVMMGVTQKEICQGSLPTTHHAPGILPGGRRL